MKREKSLAASKESLAEKKKGAGSSIDWNQMQDKTLNESDSNRKKINLDELLEQNDEDDAEDESFVDKNSGENNNINPNENDSIHQSEDKLSNILNSPRQLNDGNLNNINDQEDVQPQHESETYMAKASSSQNPQNTQSQSVSQSIGKSKLNPYASNFKKLDNLHNYY